MTPTKKTVKGRNTAMANSQECYMCHTVIRPQDQTIQLAVGESGGTIPVHRKCGVNIKAVHIRGKSNATKD